MTVGDIGTLPQQQNNDALVLDEAYKSGYYDAAGGRKQPSNFDTKMMQMLLDPPSEISVLNDFDNYMETIRAVISILPRIPNYDMAFYHEVVRDFEDIVDQAHSEGMRRVTASDMCKMILRLKAITPAGGQFEMKGLTPVSAIITTRHQSESTVKVPTQAQQPSGGTFGFLNPFSWGKK